tara:strand:+ start:142 stop:540 length:399 start_codon:yes stop_codon:yes gene_type:complete
MFIEATQNGSYAVEISKNSCVDTSVCQQILTVGVDGDAKQTFIDIYPNPTNGAFKIDLGQEENNVQIQVVNILGEVVFNNFFKSARLLDYNIESPSGLYFIKIQSKEIRKTFKIIKKFNVPLVRFVDQIQDS